MDETLEKIVAECAKPLVPHAQTCPLSDPALSWVDLWYPAPPCTCGMR